MVTDDNGRPVLSSFGKDPIELCGYFFDERVSQRHDHDTTDLESGTATADNGSDSQSSHPRGRHQKGHSTSESKTSNSSANDSETWNTSPRTPPLQELPPTQHQADEPSWMKWRRRTTTTAVDDDDPNHYYRHQTPTDASLQLPPSQTGMMMSAPIQLPTWQVLKANISTLDLSVDDDGNDDDCDHEQFLRSDQIIATPVETNTNVNKRRVPNKTKQLSLPFTPSLFD